MAALSPDRQSGRLIPARPLPGWQSPEIPSSQVSRAEGQEGTPSPEPSGWEELKGQALVSRCQWWDPPEHLSLTHTLQSGHWPVTGFQGSRPRKWGPPAYRGQGLE